GLISTAGINRALIPAIRASDRSELVAVASRSLAHAQRYASQWNIPQAHSSYKALLADPEVDVVYNPLPNSLHCEWTVKAAEAGKHILCEKPLAITVEEVDRMIEAATRSNVVLFEAYMYRHHPQTLRVQKLVRQGAIGQVRLVHAVFTYTLNRPGDVRLDPNLGGGSLWDVGCYPVSFAQAVTGSAPAEVFGWQKLGDSGVDMTFAGQMRFADGVLAQFDSSFQATFRARAEVIGSEGTLIVDHPWKPSIEGPAGIRLQRGDHEESVDVEEVDPYLCEVQAMERCVLDGADPVLPLSASRQIMTTLTALYESARSGKPVLT
ncbi:MAG: Gfo/Idh/MocA family protein, partial [Anaerolineae bacterium]